LTGFGFTKNRKKRKTLKQDWSMYFRGRRTREGTKRKNRSKCAEVNLLGHPRGNDVLKKIRKEKGIKGKDQVLHLHDYGEKKS